MSATGKVQLIQEMEADGLLCTEECPYVENEEVPGTFFAYHLPMCGWAKRARELLRMPEID